MTMTSHSPLSSIRGESMKYISKTAAFIIAMILIGLYLFSYILSGMVIADLLYWAMNSADRVLYNSLEPNTDRYDVRKT